MGIGKGPEAEPNRSSRLPEAAARIGAKEAAQPQKPVDKKRRAFYDHLRSEGSTGDSVIAAFAELRLAVVEDNVDDRTSLLQLKSDANTGRTASRACVFENAARYFDGVVTGYTDAIALIDVREERQAGRQGPPEHGGPVVSEGRVVGWQDTEGEIEDDAGMGIGDLV